MIYDRFETLMNKELPNHQWEYLTVTTSDDYILTLFHVWNEQTRDPSKGPIMF